GASVTEEAWAAAKRLLAGNGGFFFRCSFLLGRRDDNHPAARYALKLRSAAISIHAAFPFQRRFLRNQEMCRRPRRDLR
ncbi:hypothetical protein AB9E03_34190, partial [Rhizobium leguminosarum]